ncbi:MAG: DUF2911 domain-containing protein [Cyclobacteriaceae bacterium]|nr:DUF2911 domain-containing protein [Cyclobacteriaceae bacterium]
MKKIILISLSVILALIIGVVLYGVLVVSKKSPIKTTEFSSNGLDLKVVYCQPYKKGRVIFGEESQGALQPYGKYWRLGANAATEITFSKNVNFGGKPINAGTYRMYAVPGSSAFVIALNSELGVYFGVNEPDYSKDVLKIDVPVETAPETEQLTINFANDSTGVMMNVLWDTTKLSVPITAQ